MTQIEHSRLLYLIDALKSAPHKSQKLFEMALDHKDSSSSYLKIIERLRISVDMISEINKIKKEML